MNWDQIQGGRKEMMGCAKAKWADITEDGWTHIAGRRGEMVGAIQRRNRQTREEAERDVDEWSRGL